MTSSWNPWNFIQFKWLANQKNVYYLPCYKNVIIWNHPTENQARMSRAIDFLFQGVPWTCKWVLESHVPSVFTMELYSPCLLWGRSAFDVMPIFGVIGMILQATAQWAPSVGEGTEKKHKKSMVRNKHLSRKNHMEEFVRCFHVFFQSCFPPIHGFLPKFVRCHDAGL